MSDVVSFARVLDPSQVEAMSRSISAVVPRDEVREALGGDEPPELILDIARRRNGDVEAHTLRVALSDEQLEALVRDATGEEVTLVFDAEEIEQLLLDDVEAHGVREKTAAVLSVAALAAGVAASAQPAAAMHASGGQTGGSIEMISDAASSGVMQAPELISDAASSGPVSLAANAGAELISDAASTGPVPIEAEAGTPELISDAASTGPVAIETSDSALVASSVPAAQAQDAGMSGSEIAGVAAVGGLALAITAAGFAVQGRRRHLQPT